MELEVQSCKNTPGEITVPNGFKASCNNLVSFWSDWSQCARSTTNSKFTKQRTRTCLNTAACDDNLSELETCLFKVWHGEKDIAGYTVGSIHSWVSRWWQPENMFDDTPRPPDYYSVAKDLTTVWVSNPCNLNRSNCLVTITFKVLSEFKSQFTSLKPHLE